MNEKTIITALLAVVTSAVEKSLGGKSSRLFI